MKTKKLLAGAVLTIAGCAPIAGFVGVAADNINRDTGSVSPRGFSIRKLPVNPSWPLLSVRTNGSTRRR